MNSNAFKLHGKPDPEISVDLARLTTEQESLARAKNPMQTKLGLLLTGHITAIEKMSVHHKPISDNPSHSVILGNDSKQKCYLLAEKTKVLQISSSQSPQLPAAE